MAQQWRIGIRGQQRKDVDINLLIQAVIALAHQLCDDQQKQGADIKSASSEKRTSEGGNT